MMGDRARQFIFKRYTWNNIATQLIEGYQSILLKDSRSKILKDPIREF
jgi:hypothetical protein